MNETVAKPSVQIRDFGNKTIVDIEIHNIDFQNTDSFKSLLSELAQQGRKNVILNMKQVTFMDSIGLSLLTLGKRLMDKEGGTFGICAPQCYVKNLLTLTNLNKIIEVYQNDEEALQMS